MRARAVTVSRVGRSLRVFLLLFRFDCAHDISNLQNDIANNHPWNVLGLHEAQCDAFFAAESRLAGRAAARGGTCGGGVRRRNRKYPKSGYS